MPRLVSISRGDRICRRLLSAGVPILGFLAPAASAQSSGALTTPRTEGVVLVELIVEDAKAKPITDLRPAELAVEQDGVRQDVQSLQYRSPDGYYELLYAPSTGRAGAVAIGVARKGSRLRGLDGPQVKPRFLPPTPAFELPLRAALDEVEAPAQFRYEMEVLRFEEREGTLHHSVVAQIPLAEVGLYPSAAGMRVQLSFLLRVKSETGRIIHLGSLEQPLELEPGAERLLGVKRFVRTSHLHLRPGRYLVELVVMDERSGKRSVRRLSLDVEPWLAGLHASSLVFLLGADGLMAGETEDNPFRLEDAALVPMLRPTWIAGSSGPLWLLAYLFPSPVSPEPLRATMELRREGLLRAKVALPLPAPSADGRIRYLGGLKFQSLQPGEYNLRLVIEQGAEQSQQEAVLRVVPPSRLQ